ncbi:MAG: Crp/Fnr family transcriptional regulator [Gemmatimonadota bacterium]
MTTRNPSPSTFVELLAAVPGVVSRHLPALGTVDADTLRSRVVVVKSGCVGVRIEDLSGDRFGLEVGGRDCVLGLWPAAGGSFEMRLVHVYALVPSVILEASLGVLLRGLAADPALTRAAVEATGRQYACLLRRASILRIRRPLQRLAAALDHLMEHAAEHCAIGNRHFLPLTQDTIAEVANLSRQTTNRELRRFAAMRVVHLERAAVCVLDPERLRAVAHGDPEPRRQNGRTHCRRVNPGAPLDCVEDV